MALAIGYNEEEIVLRKDNTPFDIHQMMPHTPYPKAEATGQSEDTIVLLRTHPGACDDPLDSVFFEHLFRHLDECWAAGKKTPDLVQLLVSQ